MNLHLTVVEGFECASDPRSYVVGGNLLLVGSLKANWSEVRDQTQCDLKDLY